MTRSEGPASVVGVLLAGGQARRMGGGDKCLRLLGGRPLLAHVIERARPQVGDLILNAHGDPARFAAFGLPVVPDPVGAGFGAFAGPLAGVLAGLTWTKAHRPDAPWIVTIATDTPFFPKNLVGRFLDAVAGPALNGQAGEQAGAPSESYDLVCAASGGRTHPVFGLWPVALQDDLERAITAEGIRKVDHWTARHRLALVEFETSPFDPFFNTNHPDDLAQAEALLAETGPPT